MSYIKIVVLNGDERVSFEDHYSYPMNVIQGKTEHKDLGKQLRFLLEKLKGTRFDAGLVDAGLIVFDLRKKVIDNKDNGGFSADSLVAFPKGWKLVNDGVFGTVDYAKWKKIRADRDSGMDTLDIMKKWGEM